MDPKAPFNIVNDVVGASGSSVLHYVATVTSQNVFYNTKRLEVIKYATQLDERKVQFDSLDVAINSLTPETRDIPVVIRAANMLQEERHNMRPGRAEVLLACFRAKVVGVLEILNDVKANPTHYDDHSLKELVHLCSTCMEIFPSNSEFAAKALKCKAILNERGTSSIKQELVDLCTCYANAPLDNTIGCQLRSKLELAGKIDMSDKVVEIKLASSTVMDTLCNPVDFPARSVQADQFTSVVSLMKSAGLGEESDVMELKLLERKLMSANLDYGDLGATAKERVAKDAGDQMFGKLRLAHHKFVGRRDDMVKRGREMDCLEPTTLAAAAEQIHAAKLEYIVAADAIVNSLGHELAKSVCAKPDYSRGWGDGCKNYNECAVEITNRLALAENNTLKSRIKVFEQVFGE